jgi:hypothetical protein
LEKKAFRIFEGEPLGKQPLQKTEEEIEGGAVLKWILGK